MLTPNMSQTYFVLVFLSINNLKSVTCLSIFHLPYCTQKGQIVYNFGLPECNMVKEPQHIYILWSKIILELASKPHLISNSDFKSSRYCYLNEGFYLS